MKKVFTPFAVALITTIISSVALAADNQLAIGSDTVLEKITFKDAKTGVIAAEQTLAFRNDLGLQPAASTVIKLPANYPDGKGLQIIASVRVKANSPAQNNSATLAVRFSLFDKKAFLQDRLDKDSDFEAFDSTGSQVALTDKFLKVQGCFADGERCPSTELLGTYSFISPLIATATPAPIKTTPTAVPTVATPKPTAVPTKAIPTIAPTSVPTVKPTKAPTAIATSKPTETPKPTSVPTKAPTVKPTDAPKATPVATKAPTSVPTKIATVKPTDAPKPTSTPTKASPPPTSTVSGDLTIFAFKGTTGTALKIPLKKLAASDATSLLSFIGSQKGELINIQSSNRRTIIRAVVHYSGSPVALADIDIPVVISPSKAKDDDIRNFGTLLAKGLATANNNLGQNKGLGNLLIPTTGKVNSKLQIAPGQPWFAGQVLNPLQYVIIDRSDAGKGDLQMVSRSGKVVAKGIKLSDATVLSQSADRIYCGAMQCITSGLSEIAPKSSIGQTIQTYKKNGGTILSASGKGIPGDPNQVEFSNLALGTSGIVFPDSGITIIGKQNSQGNLDYVSTFGVIDGSKAKLVTSYDANLPRLLYVVGQSMAVVYQEKNGVLSVKLPNGSSIAQTSVAYDDNLSANWRFNTLNINGYALNYVDDAVHYQIALNQVSLFYFNSTAKLAAVYSKTNVLTGIITDTDKKQTIYFLNGGIVTNENVLLPRRDSKAAYAMTPSSPGALQTGKWLVDGQIVRVLYSAGGKDIIVASASWDQVPAQVLEVDNASGNATLRAISSGEANILIADIRDRQLYELQAQQLIARQQAAMYGVMSNILAIQGQTASNIVGNMASDPVEYIYR